MRKLIFITTVSILTFIFGLLIFLITIGIKTEAFNNLINEKISEINPKIKLKLNDVNFKLNSSNYEFEIVTLDTRIAVNEKSIDLETIKFDFNIFDYLNKKNPISQISISTKENNISEIADFINEYDFNLARNLILKQIKKGKIKIFSDITFDKKNPNKLIYLINGAVKDAEVIISNKSKIENIKFNFIINQNTTNLKEIELYYDNIFLTSKEVEIYKDNKRYEINGNFKTKKTKINLNKYKKIFNLNLDLLDSRPINLSSDNKLSFEINNRLVIKNLILESKLSFDEIYTKPKYQDFIYLKNGDILINYNKKNLEIILNSNFLFKNIKNNNETSNNLIKAIYKKKLNEIASVKINLSNSKNKINSREFKKFISLKNFNLTKQDIFFSSENYMNFNLNKNNKIENFNIKSKIKADNILFQYKSQRIKKYFSNFKNQINLSDSNIELNYSNKNFKLDLKSKYSLNEIYEDISLNVQKKNKNYLFDLNVDLDNAEININELDYKKKLNVTSNLYINGIYKDNNEIFFNDIHFKEEEKNLIIQNLEIGKNDKIKNLDLFKIDLSNKIGKKNNIEFKKINNNYYLTGNQFDGTQNIKNILDNSSKSIFSNFKNLNTYIYLDIGKYFID